MDVVRDNIFADHFSFFRTYHEFRKKATHSETGQDTARGYAA
jgi:hypothetical protein